MADLLDEKKRLDAMVRQAIRNKDQAALHQKVHVVFHEQVRKERRQNVAGSTKVVIDCGTPEIYRDLRWEVDRVRDIAKDGPIAAAMIRKAIQLITDEIFKAWIETGYAPKISGANIPVDPDSKKKAPPKAEIPTLDWLK